MVRAIDNEVCKMWVVWWWEYVLEEGTERKDGKESSTPENSTNKTFQVLTLRKAHEPTRI